MGESDSMAAAMRGRARNRVRENEGGKCGSLDGEGTRRKKVKAKDWEEGGRKEGGALGHGHVCRMHQAPPTLRPVLHGALVPFCPLDISLHIMRHFQACLHHLKQEMMMMDEQGATRLEISLNQMPICSP